MKLYDVLVEADNYSFNKWLWGRAKKHVRKISDKLHALGYDFTSDAGGVLLGDIELYMTTSYDTRTEINPHRFIIYIMCRSQAGDNRSHFLCYEAKVMISPDHVQETDNTMGAILYARRRV